MEERKIFLEDEILDKMNLAFIYDQVSDLATEWEHPLIVSELRARYNPEA